jgi:membrane protease YdiL (CAAX protease family)
MRNILMLALSTGRKLRVCRPIKKVHGSTRYYEVQRMPISPSSLIFIFIICVFFPWLAIRTASKTRKPGGTPTRAQFLISVIFSQGFSVILALSAARYDNIDLFPPPQFGWVNGVIILAFLVIALGTLPWRWSWKTPAQKRKYLWIVPTRFNDLGSWLLISFLAGTCEEIVYRGALFVLWARLLGSWQLAMIPCIAAFSLAHFLQGWKSMLVIAVLSVFSHLIVRYTGDLYTVMIIHFVYDLLAGMIILLLLRREGITQEVPIKVEDGK